MTMVPPKELQRRIVEALETHGPMTVPEICDVVGVHSLNTQPRVSELKDMGLVVVTGLYVRSRSGTRVEVVKLPHQDNPKTKHEGFGLL